MAGCAGVYDRESVGNCIYNIRLSVSKVCAGVITVTVTVNVAVTLLCTLVIAGIQFIEMIAWHRVADSDTVAPDSNLCVGDTRFVCNGTGASKQ